MFLISFDVPNLDKGYRKGYTVKGYIVKNMGYWQRKNDVITLIMSASVIACFGEAEDAQIDLRE
jgi:hypothetical protein